MTTMLEVAKRAGVSKATVSRVLSGNGYVSQETKDRVFQAIEESGYRPNLLARNLATKRTQTLGLVVTNTLYHGVYFSELLFHAARMTEEKGRQLILADGKHSADEEREAIQYLLDMRCDAVIIYPRFLSVEEMDEIGYEDYFYGEGVCLIEWADLIREILPEQMCRVTIEKDLEKGFDYRKITLEGFKGIEEQEA